MAENEYKLGLTDFAVSDDLDVSMDNDTYQDQANPAPPVKGNYRLRAVTLKQATYRSGEREGQPVLVEGKYPVFTLGVAEIVEGLGDEPRKVGLFYDIPTKPFERHGSVVSVLGDITRSYGTPNWRGLDPEDPDSGISRLREAFESQQLFTAQLDWNVYDGAFAKAAIEQLGLSESTRESRAENEDERKLYNAVYRAARIQGMQNFPYNPSSERFSHVLVLGDVQFKNPVTSAVTTIEVDQRALEARATISRFFPNTDYEAGRVKIGPMKVRPAQAKVAA